MLVSDQTKSDEVLNTLADKHSGKILLSIINESLSIHEISQRTNVPLRYLLQENRCSKSQRDAEDRQNHLG